VVRSGGVDVRQQWLRGGRHSRDISGYIRQRLKFVWSSERCTRRYNADASDYCLAKPLRKLKRQGHPLSRVLMIDDSPEKHAQNYGNLLRLRPFLGDPADVELREVLPFLGRLKNLTDIRTVEKRGWRRSDAM
jgi:RNA polymerase II subunit A small phosphatase-like protein